MILERTWQVTRDNGPRPAGPPDRCFYCTRALGQAHAETCVLYQRTVKIRAVVEYEVRVPAAWTPERVEQARNESVWSAGNVLFELERLEAAREECLVGLVRCEYAGEGEAEWDARP